MDFDQNLVFVSNDSYRQIHSTMKKYNERKKTVDFRVVKLHMDKSQMLEST